MKSRLQRERITVKKMIELYCKHNHEADLCTDCSRLMNYADTKLAKCPFEDKKPACNECTVHCYRSEEREEIRRIMRFSGPKMTFRHPYLAIWHIIDKNRKTNISELSALLAEKQNKE